MRRGVLLAVMAAALWVGGSNQATLDAQRNGPKKQCATIQSGAITDTMGQPIRVGFDEFGYNYQAHEFNGTYDGLDRVLDGKYVGMSGDFVDDRIWMKWSDDWIANVDCTGDGKLDRGAAGVSQGWLTNHINGDYDSDGDGTQDAHYTDFVKIVWVGPGGNLWGQYEVIQEVLNDPVSGLHGLLSKMPSPGLGLNDGWTD